MGNKRRQLPDYDSIIGGDTEVVGDIHFNGALHVDGKVIGDVSGQSADGCALTLGRSGVIEGNVDVAHVLLAGTVKGDVRATYCAELNSGARIEGKLYYRMIEIPEGAEINGELVHIAEPQIPQLLYQQEEGEEDEEEKPTDDEEDPAEEDAAADETAGDGDSPDNPAPSAPAAG